MSQVSDALDITDVFKDTGSLNDEEDKVKPKRRRGSEDVDVDNDENFDKENDEDEDENEDDEGDEPKIPSVENMRPLKQQKTSNGKIQINSNYYKRQNMGKSNNDLKDLVSNETHKELESLFYKNSKILPIISKRALDKYIVNHVKKYFYETTGSQTKISMTKESSIPILNAITQRIETLFQQVKIHIQYENPRFLNLQLSNSLLTRSNFHTTSSSAASSKSKQKSVSKSSNPLHLVQKNNEKKILQSFLPQSNGSFPECLLPPPSEKNLTPLELFAAVASLNPAMTHNSKNSKGSFKYPESYESMALLHKIYIFLKNFVKTQSTKGSPNKDEIKNKKDEKTLLAFESLEVMFSKDKRICFTNEDDFDKKKVAAMFVSKKAGSGLLKRYGFERCSQFSKYIIEAYSCLFLQELSYDIFCLMQLKNTSQINTNIVRSALSEFGY